ncbi:MAG TPA: type VI secretion system-associated protein TagF [Steroidobacteraceae bacterium]|nr:type VI secretion system-associated protein TagF [Steroidobacteraceae bacterium]
MELGSSLGFFGKLPCNGDFVQRRVPQSFLDAWDPWLQECIHDSRAELQESWLPSYLSSPVWRFVLPDAACGSGAYAGSLTPSVDKVGRYFPVTVVTPLDIGICPLDFAIRHASWFDALEELAVTTLASPDLDLEWFDERVIELGRHLAAALSEIDTETGPLLAQSDFPRQGRGWRVPLRSAGALQSAVSAFAYSKLSEEQRPAGVWWTEGSSSSVPSWLVVRGLPRSETFAAMLNGEWARHGWNDVGSLTGGVLREQPAVTSILEAQTTPEEDSRVVPHATVPLGQLSAIEVNRAAFVLRPEIGVWAVAATESDSDAAGLRTLADALQQVNAAPTLSGLVEGIRTAMFEVHEAVLRMANRDILQVRAPVTVVVLAVHRAECAFLSAGAVQKVRIRAGRTETVDPPTRESHDAGSLMDLLSDDAPLEALGTEGFREIHVHYDRLQRGDQWVLAAREVIHAASLARLAATAASGIPVNAQAIGEMLEGAYADTVVPLLTWESV